MSEMSVASINERAAEEYYKRGLEDAQNLARTLSQPGIIADSGAWEACGCGVF